MLSLQSKLKFVSGAALAMLALPAFAQNTTPPEELPPLSVSANRPVVKRTNPTAANIEGPATVVSPTTVPTPVEQTASSITVITSADLERDQRRTAADALQSVPGLNVVQSGGPGAQTSIFMRGTNSNHTKIFIDGIDVGDPSSPTGAFDFGQLTTADIDRIEILRGPQSGLYGSDAIGGVISITTKRGEGPPKVRAMIEGGSRGTINSAAGVSGSQDRFNYAFNFSNYRTASTPVTPLELLPPGQARINDSARNTTYSTRLGYDVTENFALNFTGRYTDTSLFFTGDAFLPPTFAGAPAPLQSSQLAHQVFTRSEAVWSLFDGRFKNYFGFNYTNQYRFNTDPFGFFGPISLNDGERYKYDWRGVISVLQGQTVVLGAEHQTEKFNTQPGDGSSASAQNGNRAAFAELQSNFGNRFFVTSNIRGDDNDAFGQRTTYRVAPAFIVPTTDTKLKVSYGTGFKAPTLVQLFDPNFGNRNLRPEESKGYDAGFEQPLAGGRILFGSTYFNNEIVNLIVNAATFPFPYSNINAARTEGFETFAAVNFNDRFKVRIDHTYTDAVDARTGLELRRRPRDKASFSAIWSPTDVWTLSATIIAIGPFRDVPRVGGAELTNPGYTVVNLAANYQLANGVTAFARVDNLTNAQFQNPTGFLNPGLGVFGGLRLTSR